MLQLVFEILFALVFVFSLYLVQRMLIGKIECFRKSKRAKNSDFKQKSDKND